jgi:hypothetical protein
VFMNCVKTDLKTLNSQILEQNWFSVMGLKNLLTNSTVTKKT